MRWSSSVSSTEPACGDDLAVGGECIDSFELIVGVVREFGESDEVAVGSDRRSNGERAFYACAAERRAISMPIYVRPLSAAG